MNTDDQALNFPFPFVVIVLLILFPTIPSLKIGSELNKKGTHILISI